MERLFQMFPFIGSPKFYGVVLTATALWLQNYGFVWSAQALADWLVVIAGGATTVGVLDSAAKKIAKK